MDVRELRQKSEKELANLLKEKQAELSSLRFKASGRQLKNVRAFRAVKKEIAQIHTIQIQNQSQATTK